MNLLNKKYHLRQYVFDPNDENPLNSIEFRKIMKNFKKHNDSEKFEEELTDYLGEFAKKYNGVLEVLKENNIEPFYIEW